MFAHFVVQSTNSANCKICMQNAIMLSDLLFRVHVLAGQVVGELTEGQAEESYVANMRFAAEQAAPVS